MNTSKKEIRWYEKISGEKKSHGDRVVSRKESVEGKAKTNESKEHVNLEKYMGDVVLWLRAIEEEMKLEARPDIALQALRGVLHALRDRMIPDEVFNFSAQLPLLIRGMYFEGYRLSGKPEKFNAEELLERIAGNFGGNTSIDPKVAFNAVLTVLYNRISRGELKDIYRGMPEDIKELWYENLKHTQIE